MDDKMLTDILRMSEDPMHLHAAARLTALAEEVARLRGVLHNARSMLRAYGSPSDESHVVLMREIDAALAPATRSDAPVPTQKEVAIAKVIEVWSSRELHDLGVRPQWECIPWILARMFFGERARPSDVAVERACTGLDKIECAMAVSILWGERAPAARKETT